MPFYQTNPPFFERILSASIALLDGYNLGRHDFSVGSFWKTNPPGHHNSTSF